MGRRYAHRGWSARTTRFRSLGNTPERRAPVLIAELININTKAHSGHRLTAAPGSKGEHHNGPNSTLTAQAEEEGQPAARRPEHRLQGRRNAAEIHFRARQDPSAPGDRALGSRATSSRHRH